MFSRRGRFSEGRIVVTNQPTGKGFDKSQDGGDAAAPGPLRILLLATDPVTQKVIAGLLRTRGHDVLMAANVPDALQRVIDEQHQVLLMDAELLDIDAGDTIASMRTSLEGLERDVPVVVVNAAPEDPRTFSAADRLLTKPIHPQDLYDAVEGRPAATAAGPLPEVPPPLDWLTAVKHMDGREELLRELVGTFHLECDHLLEQIRDAFEQHDQKALQRAAHTMKGAADLFCATATVDAARRVEFLARDGELAAAQEAWVQLQRELKRLLPALAPYRQA